VLPANCFGVSLKCNQQIVWGLSQVQSQFAPKNDVLLQVKVRTATKSSGYTRATVDFSCCQRMEVGGERCPGRQYTLDSLGLAVLFLRQPEVRPK
jgi:hypothetical protein